MPKRLLERVQPDSIAEFRRAAIERFNGSRALALADRRTAAIYLAGYAAEMTLKAAYFGMIGYPASQTITMADLRGAKANAVSLGFTWFGNFHDLGSWAQLVVLTRGSNAAWMYTAAGFDAQVVGHSMRLHRLWSETIRYHKNVAYQHEVNAATASAHWLLSNSSQI